MNNQVNTPTTQEKYLALLNYGINPKFIANTLNDRQLVRKTNSPYVAQTVVYTANGYQRDENIERLIDELFFQYCSKNTLQTA